MKNIHILKTDKPSKIGRFMDTNNLFIRTSVEIYVTNDEAIKKGDWFIYRNYKLCKCTGLSQSKEILTDNEIAKHQNYGKPQGLCKKVILTDNQDLIKDGVQHIPDEFLNWFVKNQSCEEVEVEKTFVTNSGLGYLEYAVLDHNFKVIEINAKIPQTSYYLNKVTILNTYEYVTDYKLIIPQEEPKQEQLNYKELSTRFTEKLNSLTLEAIADRLYQQALENDLELTFHDGVKLGVEFMQQTTEKDMLDFAWFVVKNLGQYPNDEKAHFEGKYLEKFRNK